MPLRVTIVDYGLGNLFSLRRALDYLGAEVQIATSPREIEQAERVILPGVGAFGDGMRLLRERGFFEPLRRVGDGQRPMLGICLGMQLLFSLSEEFGRHEGLQLLRGNVVRLNETDAEGRRVKIPHVGWSALFSASTGLSWDASILNGLTQGESVYFVHSYVPKPEEPAVVAAQMRHGGRAYCAMVQQKNLVGCQFHPEKSGEAGLFMLRNFISLC